MSSVPQGDYQSIAAMEGGFVSGKMFFVEVAGSTNNTHTPFVSYMKSMGFVEVPSPEDSNFILVFCPIVSRVGTDIGEALQNLDPNKQKMLVVMHHTFNADVVVAESRRQVEDPNVVLTVDCLFYETKLLRCNRNDIAWDQMCRSLGIPSPQATSWERFTRFVSKYRWMIITGTAIGVAIVIILPSVLASQNKHKQQ